jgi:putative transposase
VVENQVEVPNRTGHSAVGFDFGLKTFLTASDGTTYASPEFLKQSLADLRRASRHLSGKQRYSKNWYKAKKQVARIHQRVVNQRRDWFFKLAHELTDRYDWLFFEDLAMKGMQALWGRKVSDLARSEFMHIIQWVALPKEKHVHTIDRFYPSSKTCSACGSAHTALSLSDRHWTCQTCGSHHDRDLNASVNICTEGIRCCGVGDVRRALSPAVPA